MKDEEKAGCFVIAALGVVLAVCLMLSCAGGIHFSDGYRDGVVQKFSGKGLVWTTREGELATDGFRASGEGMSGATNVFYFTVDNAGVAREIEALPGGARVRLHYRQQLLSPVWKGETGYFVTRVERLS